jgi:dTMP kinase
MFIVFEGLDGSGTSTQLTLIGDWLGCYTTSEPSNSSVGKFIRESLKTGELSPTTMALLFAADRKEHLEKEIEPRLVRGEIVICDRYIMSSLAYQAASGVDLSYIKCLNIDYRQPDYTFYFDIDVATASLRRKERGVEDCYENTSFQTKVRKEYCKLLQDPYEQVQLIHAEHSVEDVTKQLKKELRRINALKDL